jgi:hypothetical protein
VSDPGPDEPLSRAEIIELARLTHEARQAERGASGLQHGADVIRRSAREHALRLAQLRARFNATRVAEQDRDDR